MGRHLGRLTHGVPANQTYGRGVICRNQNMRSVWIDQLGGSKRAVLARKCRWNSFSLSPVFRRAKRSNRGVIGPVGFDSFQCTATPASHLASLPGLARVLLDTPIMETLAPSANG